MVIFNSYVKLPEGKPQLSKFTFPWQHPKDFQGTALVIPSIIFCHFASSWQLCASGTIPQKESTGFSSSNGDPNSRNGQSWRPQPMMKE